MNVKNRIARILTALSRCSKPEGDTSNRRLMPDAVGVTILPADATAAEKLLHSQCKSMWASMLSPSLVDEMFPVAS